MTRMSMKKRLLATTVAGSALFLLGGAGSALAQTASAAQAQDETQAVDDIVVTGSRIRRVQTTTAAPVSVIDAEVLSERGFVQVGQALNQITSATPSTPVASGSGSAAGSGQQFPNLFGLGAGRTLSLVNGRRFVTSSSGMGDRVVDTNLIPVGLLERVDVVQAGGAAVYGSDAIAGVINYVLKDDFEGLEVDAQYGISSRDDYPQTSLRMTFGDNFLDGRANLAGNVEWSKSDPLYGQDRPRSNLSRLTVSNAANTGPGDGIPAVRELLDAHFWPFNTNGLIFSTPAPVQGFLVRSGGVPQQFSADGSSLIAYNTGVVAGVPFASGGDGFDYRDLAALYSGVERFNVNLLGRYDLTDRIKLKGELLYSNTEGRDPYGTQGSTRTVLNSAASGAGPIAFFRTNPFLTPTALAQLTAANPGFAAGAPLWLSKSFSDALPTREFVTETDVWRGLVALEGDFDWADRNFYWSLSASRGITKGERSGWDTWTSRLTNAVNATRNTGGQAVCAINADASTTNDDAACVPINIFGTGTITDEMRAYVAVPVGERFENTQDDILATIGGEMFTLPAGAASFSLAYEYRREKAEFNPFDANQRGLTGSGTPTRATSGAYNTNEFSAEVLVPIFGGDFTLPFVNSLEVDGAYRTVDNSIAGKADVWGAGLRWEVVSGVTVRASRSRNFRAPTLDQLFSPSSTTLGAIAQNPCDADRINSGANPAVRLANCQALFAANPGYGALTGFQDPGENFNNVLITTGGNSNLKNEISDTTTFGVVLQPGFAPGLTIVADRIQVELRDGLSAFTPQDFMATCFDSSPQPADVCGQFTFNALGQVATANSTTFNAGTVRYEGEIYTVNYAFDVADLTRSDADWGRLELGLEVTHNALLETSVTGFDYNRTDDTTLTPDWVSRFDARYALGPVRLSYSMNYLPKSQVNRFDTIETTPTPLIEENVRHNLSGEYRFGDYAVRAGVINLTDEEPSYPTRNYGDILGRQYFVGLNARF